MQENHPCSRKGRNNYEAECLVCKSGIYIYLSCTKGNGDLNTILQSKKHRKAVRGAVVSTKMTNYFVTSESKCEDEITAAEGTLAFHAVKHHHQRRSSRPPNPPIGGARPTLEAQVSLKLLFGYVTIFSSADLFTTDLNCRKKLACDIISECDVILLAES